MSKRIRQEDEIAKLAPAAKRSRPPPQVDRFSRLSDELILRILSFLSVHELVVCERLSRKHKDLARDGQLWKSHYYSQFVKPRAKRLPGAKEALVNGDAPGFASKVAKWLDDSHLVKRATNWKRQYKLRHNWTRGSCEVKEIPVADQSSVPPMLVEFQDSVIFMADLKHGLRAWSAKRQEELAQFAFQDDSRSPPTSLAARSSSNTGECMKVMVGFENGSFSLYHLDMNRNRFEHRYTQAPSTEGVVSALSISWPYVVTMTATQLLSLYIFEDSQESSHEAVMQPRRVLQLRSKTAWPPLSVSLRSLSASVTITIAFALPTYLSGWTVGIQEIKTSPDGTIHGTRLASAIDEHYRPFAFASRPMFPHISSLIPTSTSVVSTRELRHIHSKPTSLSYTHPYLLVSHPDNTLTLYLVTSTTETLSIGPPSRLWGHTSSVSGARVGGRGKAVSISRRGDELRVWELEGGFTSSTAKKRLADSSLSVQIRPEKISANQAEAVLTGKARSETFGRGETSASTTSDLTLTRGWVGFDEENVVFLKEEGEGPQALVVYDFA